MSFIASFLHKGKVETTSFDGDKDQVVKSFTRKMEEFNPIWANLICSQTGEQVSRYEQQDFLGVFEAEAKLINEPDGKYVGVWTDGVLLKQRGKKTALVSNFEPLAAFRLKKGLRYRVTVTEINED